MSAAAIINCYGDKIYISHGALIMYHNASIDGETPTLISHTKKHNRVCVNKGLMFEHDLQAMARGAWADEHFYYKEQLLRQFIKDEYRDEAW
jgi:hypothetical protein